MECCQTKDDTKLLPLSASSAYVADTRHICLMRQAQITMLSVMEICSALSPAFFSQIARALRSSVSETCLYPSFLCRPFAHRLPLSTSRISALDGIKTDRVQNNRVFSPS